MASDDQPMASCTSARCAFFLSAVCPEAVGMRDLDARAPLQTPEHGLATEIGQWLALIGPLYSVSRRFHHPEYGSTSVTVNHAALASLASSAGDHHTGGGPGERKHHAGW